MVDNPFAIMPLAAVIAYAADITREREAFIRLGGWLPCDGRPLNSTDPEYADLFSVIGTTHGAGFDESGTKKGDFNLPDYRGRFLRGVAGATGPTRDPDIGFRKPMAQGGQGGASVGSVQPDATRLPRNGFTTGEARPPTHQHQDPTFNGVPGPFELAGGATGRWNYDYGDQSAPTTPDGAHTHAIAGGGDAETRPVNAYVNWIIKFKHV